MNDATDEMTLVRPPRPDPAPYGDFAMMLAEATDTDAFEETPTAICCPNCAELIDVFPSGLPTTVAQFGEYCLTCDIPLQRWSAVAVDGAYADIVDATKLTEMTQAYWNARLQAGITNTRQEARNYEYMELFGKTADAFGWDWELSCPLCRRSKTALREAGVDCSGYLDYHHWVQTPDRGVTLCRECHDIIGLNLRDTQLEGKAREWGVSSKKDLQVIRLALREAVATDRQLHPEMASRLVERYNLVQTPAEVEALVEAVCTDEDLYEQVVDDALWNSFEDRR